MIIRNVSRHDLDNALAAANRPTDAAPNYRIGYGGNGFGGNIVFKRCDRQTQSHSDKPYSEPATYSVTLTVKDSRAHGARRSTDGNRRIKAACWHAHGAFMRALPTAAIVKSNAGGETITIADPRGYNYPRKYKYIAPLAWSPGDELRDYNIGSQMYPCMASEACEC